MTDSTHGSVISQLTQAILTATAGDNGTNNQADLQSVATQPGGIRDEVLALANTTYRSSYLFSGSQSTVRPFSLDSSTDPAVVAYHGEAVQSFLTTPLGGSIALDTPGSQIFTAGDANVFGTLNQLISDFLNGNVAAAQADTAGLTTAVSYVSQQRVVLDDSITRMNSQDSSLQQQLTQLVVWQTDLMQADIASVATQLSSRETQQATLEDTIAALERQGNLFDLLK